MDKEDEVYIYKLEKYSVVKYHEIMSFVGKETDLEVI
jgi:hypothetical protein